jgi:uncharacterized alkaline shock family protein YloU
MVMYMETTECNALGSIHISQRAISIIAAVTAAAIPSVVSLGASLKEVAAAKIGRAALDQGADTVIEGEDTAEITVRLVVRYGCRIPDLALKVQKSVKDAVEDMTGCHVTAVHVVIQNIEFPKNGAEA